ncbi:MAG: hypothetical protein ACC661_10935 [Verrucomicrobiales bacterium]
MSGSRKKIAFICTANMCRSPMAEAIFDHEATKRGLAVDCFSAGTLGMAGYPPMEEALAACANHGVPAPNITSSSVHDPESPLRECVRVFVMEAEHGCHLLENDLAAPDRITMLGEFRKDKIANEEIPDPVGLDQGAFDRCFELLRDCITAYLDGDEVGELK